jgi:hypothetical protein
MRLAAFATIAALALATTVAGRVSTPSAARAEPSRAG